MTLAYIGLGSNLSDPAKQITLAIKAIKLGVDGEVIATSSVYFSRPMGPQDQPDYTNAVLALETNLTAIALLDQLQALENAAGRVRKDNRWGARILDLDILLFGNSIIKNERLTIPHYGLKNREFVLIPLAEITHNYILPDGDNITTLSKNMILNGLMKY